MERDSKKIIKRLKREGWILRNVKGSHAQFVKDDNRLTVPHPKKTCPMVLQERLHALRVGLKGVTHENIFCSGQQRT